MALVITVSGILVALAAQAYFVLFLQNWAGVGVDRGAAAATGSALFVNLLLVAAFGAVHSLMARPAFKRAWINARAERGVYLLVSGLTLAALCRLWQPIAEPVLWRAPDGTATIAVLALFFAGLALVGWAVMSIDALHFHGLRQARSDSPVDPPFSVRGPYRFVRHPIQTGLIVALWASPVMSLGHAQLALLFTTYSVIATLRLEERDLRRGIGDEYERYRQRVPALIPWQRPKSGE